MNKMMNLRCFTTSGCSKNSVQPWLEYATEIDTKNKHNTSLQSIRP